MVKCFFIIFILVVVVVLLFILWLKKVECECVDEMFVIIMLYNEVLWYEFGVGFCDWYKKWMGKMVVIDWWVIGGMSEIVCFLEGEYMVVFELYWMKKLGCKWSSEV